MFAAQQYADLRRQVEQIAAAREHTGLASGTQICEALRAVRASIDLLDGVHADLLARLQATAGYADEGASSTIGWTTRELRMGRGEASKHRRAGDTLQTLPDVAAALAAGRIRLGHVFEFTAGITKLGAAVMTDLQEILLPVAETGSPDELKATITQIHQVVHADELDDKYASGMARKDLKANRCGEGYHVTGFLDIITGAKFATWLKDVSAPEYDGDDRTPAARRVDAFCRVFAQAIRLAADEAGEPRADSDDVEPGPGSAAGGADEDEPTAASAEPIRPPRKADTSLLVLADLETLLRLPGAQPATLVGFGAIGTQLLGYLTCTGDTTGILTDGLTAGPVPQAEVVNVGRASRLATMAQRKAILARQDGVCANPGCGSTMLEYHHVAWWERDHGRTDLSNLVGICGRCHHLVHQSKLLIEPDGAGGFTFQRGLGRIIDDHTRTTKHRIRRLIAKLRHAADDPPPAKQRPPRRSPNPGRRFDPGWLTPLRSDQRSPGEQHVHEFAAGHRPA